MGCHAPTRERGPRGHPRGQSQEGPRGTLSEAAAHHRGHPHTQRSPLREERYPLPDPRLEGADVEGPHEPRPAAGDAESGDEVADVERDAESGGGRRPTSFIDSNSDDDDSNKNTSKQQRKQNQPRHGAHDHRRRRWRSPDWPRATNDNQSIHLPCLALPCHAQPRPA